MSTRSAERELIFETPFVYETERGKEILVYGRNMFRKRNMFNGLSVFQCCANHCSITAYVDMGSNCVKLSGSVAMEHKHPSNLNKKNS